MSGSITQKLQEFPIEVLSKLAAEEEIWVDDSMTKDHIINLLLDKPVDELKNLLHRAEKYKEYQELSTYLESVPKEIRVQILMQLEPDTLLAFCQTNKSWYQLCKSDAMNDYWKHQINLDIDKCGSGIDVKSSLQQNNRTLKSKYASWYQLYLDCLQDAERTRVINQFSNEIAMTLGHAQKLSIFKKILDFLIKNKQFLRRHPSFGGEIESKVIAVYHNYNWTPARGYYRRLFHKRIPPRPTESAT